MALLRSEILNLVRDKLGLQRVDYTSATWPTSAAATDPTHSDAILGDDDLWNAMKQIASDGRSKLNRKRLRLIADQYEYPLPSDCMTMRSAFHLYNNQWDPLDYFKYEEFFTGFNELNNSVRPYSFTLQEKTSNVIHSTGVVTTANSADPAILYDIAASFGVTITGQEIVPGDHVYNVTDSDSFGTVDYISITDSGNEVVTSTNVESATATTIVDTTPDSGLLSSLVEGHIIYDAANSAWGVIQSIDTDTSTITFTRLYNREAGFDTGDSYTAGYGDTITLNNDGNIMNNEQGLIGGSEDDFDASMTTLAATTFTANTVTTTTDISGVASGEHVSSRSSSQPTRGIVSSVSGSTITLTANWDNGTPSDTTAAYVGTGDEYQVESQFSTLDTMFINPVITTSDAVGTESLMILYYPYPARPTAHWHPIELSEGFLDPLIEKMLEFAQSRERGEAPNYQLALDKAILRRAVFNLGNYGNRGRRRHGTARGYPSAQRGYTKRYWLLNDL